MICVQKLTVEAVDFTIDPAFALTGLVNII